MLQAMLEATRVRMEQDPFICIVRRVLLSVWMRL